MSFFLIIFCISPKKIVIGQSSRDNCLQSTLQKHANFDIWCAANTSVFLKLREKLYENSSPSPKKNASNASVGRKIFYRSTKNKMLKNCVKCLKSPLFSFIRGDQFNFIKKNPEIASILNTKFSPEKNKSQNC